MFVEINPKNPCLSDISKNLYNGCTLICKDKEFDIKTVIDEILDFCPSFEVIPTFGFGVCYDQNLDLSFKRFCEFLESLPSSVSSALLVSSYPKRRLHTAKALELLSKSNSKAQFRFSVVYNPYSLNQIEEDISLSRKIKTGLVERVFLQLGEDLELLKKAIDKLKTLYPSIQIVGTVLNPTKPGLTKLAFWKWYGVYYSLKFYNDLEYAKTNSEAQSIILISSGCDILESFV